MYEAEIYIGFEQGFLESDIGYFRTMTVRELIEIDTGEDIDNDIEPGMLGHDFIVGCRAPAMAFVSTSLIGTNPKSTYH